jgi:MscS family membrane protein
MGRMFTFNNLAWWQWAALPILALGAWLFGMLLSRVTRAVLGWFAKRTTATWDDELIGRAGAPLTLAWALALVSVGLPWLALSPQARVMAQRFVHGLFLLAFFWMLWRSVDVTAQALGNARWSQQHPGSRALLPLGRRVAKVTVFIASIVALLSKLGYSVTSLVAGLGIGGLAVALAARSTLENLFGAFSIGADQPFREGDFVKIEDSLGTVEAIGLRSTRIRTLDRTIITLPNGKLADMKVESFAERDRIRLACDLGLVYGTTAAQMRQILTGVERVLSEHPKVFPGAITVRFKELGASALNIEVMAWFQTRDFGEFQAIRQDVLLAFMAVVEDCGSSFAFPTQTVHVVGDAGSPPARSAFTAPGTAVPR